MSVTIRDPAAAAALAGTAGPEVEVYGPDGRLLGRFAPAPRPGSMFPEFGVPDEEMDRRLNDPDARWVTGDAVMDRLRALRDVSRCSTSVGWSPPTTSSPTCTSPSMSRTATGWRTASNG